jgi:flagella basal body P-ring formation protein FlgA
MWIRLVIVFLVSAFAMGGTAIPLNTCVKDSTLMPTLLFNAEEKETFILKTSVIVVENYIKLIDLFQGEGICEKTKPILKSIYLGKSPDLGQIKDITKAEITKELERRGIDIKSYHFIGESVKVKRATLEEKKKNEAITNQIIAGIKRFFQKDVNVRLAFLPEKIFSSETIKEIIPSSDQRDLFLVKCELGGIESTYEVVAKVTHIKEIIVSKNIIYPGATIKKEDVELARVEITEDSGFLTDLDIVIGSKALKRLEINEPLKIDVIKPKPLIKTRQIIRARCKYLEVDAMALEEGSFGDIIECEYTTTKNKFRGKVISSNLVEIKEQKGGIR